MILVECNYVWSILTCVRLAYAHGTEVAVSFYFTHTGIANYCIPARRVSATILTRPSLSLCRRGWRVRLGTFRPRIKFYGSLYLPTSITSAFFDFPVDYYSVNSPHPRQMVFQHSRFPQEQPTGQRNPRTQRKVPLARTCERERSPARG